MSDNLQISELIIAKFCHDLAGPVGAINNGVELLRDPSPTLNNESIDLIEISARETVARLLYFRQAYGILNNNTNISMANIKELVKNFYIQKNLKFTWPESHGEPDSAKLIKADISKIILNLIMLIAGTLIQGGNISIKMKPQKNSTAVKVRGEGKQIKVHDHVSKPFENDFKDLEIDSKNVNAFLIKMLADRIGFKASIEVGSDYLEILVASD